MILSPRPTPADIYQWEYINPADPSQGKQQSMTLCPDGAGVDAVPGAYLTYRNLTMAYLNGADINNAYGEFVNLTDADLSQANVTYGNFNGATLTHATLHHTDLTFAFLPGATLIGADLSQANLTSAYLGAGVLTGANLAGAEVRGANLLYYSLAGANTSNLTQYNGHIAGLDLKSGARLVVRDYDGNPHAFPLPTGPIPITVEDHMVTDATGTLRMEFQAHDWHSTVPFAAGIPVGLGGTLELTFGDGVDLASQVGRTLDLFDWTGVSPSGTFAVDSPYFWDLSNLYTAGDVQFLAGGLGDFNDDRLYNCADADPLVAAIAGGTNPAAFDLTADGLVNIADRIRRSEGQRTAAPAGI